MRTKKQKIIAVLAAGLFSGSAYAAWQVNSVDALTIAPERVNNEIVETAVASSVQVPVAVNLAALEKELNKEIPATLHTINDSRGGCFKKRILVAKVSIGCTTKGRVWKDGDLKLSTQGNALVAKMPIRFEATVRGRGDIGKNIRETGRGCAEVTAVITPKINADWTASADVSTSYRWCERPYIRVLGIRITIGSQVEPKVKEALADVQPMIDAALADANFREQVEEAWVDLHQPIAFNEDPKASVVFAPESVHFGGFNMTNGVLSADVAVTGDVRTAIGDDMVAETIQPLPSISSMEGVASGFNLAVPVIIEYGEIEKALKDADLAAVLADEAGLAGDELAISDYEVYATEDAIVIGATATVKTGNPLLDTHGRFYVKAKPVVDMEKRVVAFENLGFTAATDNAVVQAGTLLIGSRPVLKAAERLIEVSFGDEYDMLVEAANTALNRDLGDGVSLSGYLNKASLSDLQIGGTELQVTINANGGLAVAYGLSPSG